MYMKMYSVILSLSHNLKYVKKCVPCNNACCLWKYKRLQNHQFGFVFLQITPLRGPREGGVLVTIRGENLGLEFTEIQGNVKVAGVDCTPIREGYIPAEQ